MKEEKFFCSKCGAMEMIFVEKSANPFDAAGARFVCRKCGYECDADFDVQVINSKNVNTFPSPRIDLDIDDALMKKIESKKWMH